MMIGAAYAAWNESASFRKMKGYSSHAYHLLNGYLALWNVATTLYATQTARIALCQMMNRQLPIIDAKPSERRCPNVFFPSANSLTFLLTLCRSSMSERYSRL